MDERPKKSPPILKRDEHNRVIDPQEGHRIAGELMGKFLHEKQLHDKDQSFHMSRTGKRDVVVHLAVTVLPSVDGHSVIGEREKEYNQWCFKLKASQLPARKGTITKAFLELFTAGKQALMALGMVTE